MKTEISLSESAFYGEIKISIHDIHGTCIPQEIGSGALELKLLMLGRVVCLRTKSVKVKFANLELRGLVGQSPLVRLGYFYSNRYNNM
jgi:hypothetical protein